MKIKNIFFSLREVNEISGDRVESKTARTMTTVIAIANTKAKPAIRRLINVDVFG